MIAIEFRTPVGQHPAQSAVLYIQADLRLQYEGDAVAGFGRFDTDIALAEKERVSGALAMMYTGQATAAAFAAPIGNYLGDIIG